MYLAEKNEGHCEWVVIGLFSSLSEAKNAFEKHPEYVWIKTDEATWVYSLRGRRHPWGDQRITEHAVQ